VVAGKPGKTKKEKTQMSRYKRGSRYWYSFIFDGRRVQASTKSKNAKVAADIERAAWNNLARGAVGLPIEGPQKNVTVGELLDTLKANYGDEKAISQQTRSVLKLARRAFGSKVASQLTSRDVEEYISSMRREGKQNATINRVTETVRRAYRVGKLTPPDIRHLSEKDNARKGFFSNDEFRRVCSGLPEDVRDFALFAYLTGWRKNEIASLAWSDIEENVIRLRAENSKNREGRSVVIAGELVVLIERRRAARLANGVLMDLVFHRDGAPIAEFRKSWASACVAAGAGRMICPKCQSESSGRKCPRCKKTCTQYSGKIFHDLRRTAVRNMVRSGVPQSVAMKISGHKTASMFRRYDIANEDDLRQAIEAVQRYHEAQPEKVVTMGNAK
jgi:integrase